jgi:hypothetical protein
MGYFVVCKLVEEKLDIPDPIVKEFIFVMSEKLTDKVKACAMAISAMRILGYREDQFTFELMK